LVQEIEDAAVPFAPGREGLAHERGIRLRDGVGRRLRNGTSARGGRAQREGQQQAGERAHHAGLRTWRTAMSVVSTSPGCEIAWAMAGAIASGSSAILRNCAIAAADSAWVIVLASSDSTAPGYTQVTRTMSLSMRRPSEIARTAYLVAQYTAAVGITNRPPIEDTFTTCPWPCRSITGSTAAIALSTPRMLTSIMRSHSSTLSADSGASGITPALFTSTSMRPKRCRACPAKACTSPREVTSSA